MIMTQTPGMKVWPEEFGHQLLSFHLVISEARLQLMLCSRGISCFSKSSNSVSHIYIFLVHLK